MAMILQVLLAGASYGRFRQPFAAYSGFEGKFRVFYDVHDNFLLLPTPSLVVIHKGDCFLFPSDFTGFLQPTYALSQRFFG